MFNVFVDSEYKKELLLDMGWMINKGWTNGPKSVYDQLDDDYYDEYLSLIGED